MPKNVFKPEEWEQLGKWGPAETNLSAVPLWVVKAFNRLHKQGAFYAAVRENKVHILRGRTFLYAAIANGQGGEYVTIMRKLRRAPGTPPRPN